MSTKTDDLMQDVAASIIRSIEEGMASGHWEKPWNTNTAMPHNAATGKVYQGGNLLWLWMTANSKDYPTNTWATYKQWDALGAQVRKGEKGTVGVKWVVKTPCKTHPEGQRCTKCSGMFPTSFVVFNAAQVDGYEEDVAVEGLSESERIERAEEFFRAVGANVVPGGDTAAFAPGLDQIWMPPFEAFKTIEGYYATLAHEHIHWTGASSRLDRDLSGRFGSEAYGAEELVAELGAAMLCAHLGITEEPRPDHARYLASWLRIIKADPKALWAAAGAASKAVEHLLETALVTA